MTKKATGRLNPQGRPGYQSYLDVCGRELRLGVNVHKQYLDGLSGRTLDLEGEHMVEAHRIATEELDSKKRTPKETILLEDVLRALGEPPGRAGAIRRRR